MANLEIKNGAAATKYLKASGAGTDLDPNIPEHKETSAAAILTAAQAIQTAAAAIQAAVETLDNIVAGSEAQVDVLTMPTTTVTGPLTDTQLRATAVPVSGTVTATTGGLTDTQLRATAVPISVASVPSHAVTGPLTNTELRAASVPTSDAGIAATTVQGVSNAVVTSADATTPVALSAAPTSGQKIRIWDLFISVDTDMWVEIEEETSGTILLKGYFKADSGINQVTPRGVLKCPVADKKVMVDTETAGNIAVTAIVSSEA